MVKLSDLVHIANNAKTDAQKNEVGEEVKKLIRGQKACHPEQHLYTKLYTTPLKITKAKQLYKLGNGAYGIVLYGCLDDKCKTQVAIKVTTEATARMEYRIAEKLKGMGVPRMYHFKSCNISDVLYFEYIKGQTLQEWMKKGQTTDAYRSLILQLIKNLKRIHEKYPKFRHHDLHWNNILVLEGDKPIMIDFGMATIEGIRNPTISGGDFENDGISPKSHYMYDAHYFLNIIYSYVKLPKVKQFVRDLFPERYLSLTSNPWIKNGRLRLGFSHGLPTYNEILKHPFLQEKKSIIQRLRPTFLTKKPMTPKPRPQAKVGTASAVRRAKAVLQKEAEKKKMPPKKPGIARAVVQKEPTITNRLAPVVEQVKKVVTPVIKRLTTPAAQRPKVFINKNGDLKIDKRKCRLYKKEELSKMFNLDPRFTKEQMCKFIKNM